jgi:hypothetical protein
VFRSVPGLDHQDLLGAGRGGEVLGDDDDRATVHRRQGVVARGGVVDREAVGGPEARNHHPLVEVEEYRCGTSTMVTAVATKAQPSNRSWRSQLTAITAPIAATGTSGGTSPL